MAKEYKNILELDTSAGMDTTRMELSALHATSSVVAGLNLTSVGGNSKALRMEAQGF